MEEINVNQWLRIPCDFVTTYDVTGQPNGRLPKTYGIRVLEVGQEFIKVFSPDLNRNVYIRIVDMKGSDSLPNRQ